MGGVQVCSSYSTPPDVDKTKHTLRKPRFFRGVGQGQMAAQITAAQITIIQEAVE